MRADQRPKVHERLVEGGVHGHVPARMHRRVGPDDTAVGQQVGEPQFSDALGVTPQPVALRSDLRLGGNTHAHGASLPHPDAPPSNDLDYPLA